MAETNLIKILVAHGADKILPDTRDLSVNDLGDQQGNEEAITLLYAKNNG